MRVITAQVAGGERNADRVLVSDDAVVVLDGATAFEPVDLDPGEYAEAIGHEIVRRLQGATIADAVAGAIEHAACAFGLQVGRSPSSTVSVLRVREDDVDLYVLGDSPIHYGTGETVHVLRDGRIDDVASSERAAYMEMLRAGHGFTGQHRRALVELQREQRRYRNQPGGYWIAETDPAAAHQGIAHSLKLSTVTWAVLGTDGAADLLAGPGPHWPAISTLSAPQLQSLLARMHAWERRIDPNGSVLPRAKRHDDKTLASVNPSAVAVSQWTVR